MRRSARPSTTIGDGPASCSPRRFRTSYCAHSERILFYAQHNFPSVCFADKAGWTYAKAAIESSSYMVTNRLMAWFTANIGYHHIHHLNARIPFYRLPQVSREIPRFAIAKSHVSPPW